MKSASRRLFVAVGFPQEAIEELVQSQLQLREKVASARWVQRQNLHLTLQFYGDVNETRIPELIERLKGVSAMHLPLELKFSDQLGYFGQPPLFRVAWVGVQDRDEQLKLLQTEIVQTTKSFVQQPEGSPAFRPHVTIARDVRLEENEIRPAKGRMESINMSGAPIRVDHFELFSSNVGMNQRIEYRTVGKFCFISASRSGCDS